MTASHLAIDGAAANLLANVTRAETLIRNQVASGACSSDLLSDLDSLSEQANLAYSDVWSSTWNNLPLRSFSCEGDVASSCSNVATATTANDIQAQSEEIFNIVRGILSANCLSDSRKRKRILRSSRRFRNAANSQLESFPAEVFSCSF